MSKRIGIIGAMPSELVDIRAALPNSNIIRKSGFDYYVNQLENGTEVIHVCSGIAKVTPLSAHKPSSTTSSRTLLSMPELLAVCTEMSRCVTLSFQTLFCRTIWICIS